MKKNSLTPDQFHALMRFAAHYGAGWKTVLLGFWTRGEEHRVQDGHLLRQIRNDLGPTWLRKFVPEKYAHQYSCGHFEPTQEVPVVYDHACAECAKSRPAH